MTIPDAAAPTHGPGTAPGWRRQLIAVAGHPTTLLIVGALTFAAAMFVMGGWIDAHRQMWESRPGAAGLTRSNSTRFVLSVGAVASLVGLTVSTLWLGFANRGRRAAKTVFWVAVVVWWLVAVPIVTTNLQVEL